MITPTNPSETKSGSALFKWAGWTLAAVALLLLVLEHRAHTLGWWLHVLLGLCVVLLYFASRAEGDDAARSAEGP